MAGTAAGMAVAGAGVVDGAPDGALAGGPLGDLDGDGVAAGDNFTEADVSSGVLSLARGDRVGFS